MRSCQRIDDHFFIGPQPTAHDLQAVKQQGWGSVQALDEAQRMGFDLRASAPFAAWVLQTQG